MAYTYVKSPAPVNGDTDAYLQNELNKIQMALASGGGGGTAVSSGGGEGGAPGIRLSLTANTAISSADAGSSTVYGVRVGSGIIAIYDGSQFVSYSFTSDRTLILDATGHTAATNYSVFAYYDGSQVQLGTGPVWSTDTTPGTGAGTSETEVLLGRVVNKYDISLRNNSVNTTIGAGRALLVGGFGTTLAGQTEDSSKKRLLSNVYNVVPRMMKRVEATDSWSGAATNAWRQANGSALNQLEFFSINGAYPVSCSVSALVTNSTSTPRTAGAGIGLDTTTAVYLTSFRDNMAVDNTRGWALKAYFNEFVVKGRHRLVWLELSGTTETRTWYGDNGDDTNFQTGMSGTLYN